MARLNLEEIGRRAGVSRSTVSRVVNGESNVSEDARARVMAVIAATGYRPHAAARSLASSRSGLIGLVIPSAVATLFDDPYFGRLILGINAGTATSDLTLALFLFDEDADEESIIRRVVNPGLVDGLVVTATKMGDSLIRHLRDARTPFVVVGRPDDSDAVSYVDVDNRGGARNAALHLATLGRRRPAMVSAPSSTTAGIDRRQGFLDGLAEAGLDIGDRMREGNWSEESGHRCMQTLLDERPDAVFAASDRMGLGVLRAIDEAGLRCPDDVSVVSFDGLIHSMTRPRLTTISQPVRIVGERAVRLLRSIIDGTVTEPQHVVFPTQLIVGESCGASSMS